jgi:lysozyme family protein
MSFDACFEVTVGHEGERLDRNPADRGNWTGGECGKGELRGSKYGISAAAYPSLDIASLSRERAAEIYQRDYWKAVACDKLRPALGLLAFDSAVNNGPARAVKFLQSTVGAAPDGQIGPATLGAIDAAERAHGGAALCIEFMAQRTFLMGSLPTWRAFGLGWSRRLAALPYEAVLLAKEVQ